MMRIAICDDDVNAVAYHESIMRQALENCATVGEISTYTTSSNFLYDIIDDSFHFDLVLLDIEMPSFSGMEIAEKIKPHLPDVKIIFITSHIEYAIDAFELSIFRYVPKAELEKRLATALIDAIKLIMIESGKTYVINNASRTEKIPYKDILYIQREEKNSLIVTTQGISKVRKSLQQIHDELDAQEFIFIDRGCIANVAHIMQIRNGLAYMKNGVTLAISRSNLQEVKQIINAYWGEHV